MAAPVPALAAQGNPHPHAGGDDEHGDGAHGYGYPIAGQHPADERFDHLLIMAFQAMTA